jgi:hypothetical protein
LELVQKWVCCFTALKSALIDEKTTNVGINVGINVGDDVGDDVGEKSGKDLILNVIREKSFKI